MKVDHERIKRIRKQRGLTQKQLSKLCGINEAQLRRYETNKGNPKIETLAKIADALEVRLEDLIPELSSNYYDKYPDEADQALFSLIEYLQHTGHSIMTDAIPSNPPTFNGIPVDLIPEDERPDESEFDLMGARIMIGYDYQNEVTITVEELQTISDEVQKYIDFLLWKKRTEA